MREVREEGYMDNRQRKGDIAPRKSDQASPFAAFETIASRIHFNESACANEVSASKQASKQASNNCANPLTFSPKFSFFSKKKLSGLFVLKPDREVQQ